MSMASIVTADIEVAKLYYGIAKDAGATVIMRRTGFLFWKKWLVVWW